MQLSGANNMEIINMKSLDEIQLKQAAQMLTDELPLGWSTLDEAMYEIKERWNSKDDAVFIAAVNNNDVIGWCGILPQYDGHVFELHPLVVRRDWQRKGIGTLLVNEITNIARNKGGLTIWVGADDERPGGETSFANVDLYDNLPKLIREYNPGTHQTALYIKLGFKIIGVMPDANGIGKPDIYLAKCCNDL
jgi:aminoglycoside 6'-N-acetyltransferase I